MLFNTRRVLERLTDYTKLPDGTWAAEVRALQLHATGLTPIDCKYRLLDEFDVQLAAWLVSLEHADPGTPPELSPP